MSSRFGKDRGAAKREERLRLQEQRRMNPPPASKEKDVPRPPRYGEPVRPR